MAKCEKCDQEARGNSPTCYDCYKAWKRMQNETFEAMKEFCGGFNGETAEIVAIGMKRLFKLWEEDKEAYKEELAFIRGTDKEPEPKLTKSQQEEKLSTDFLYEE